MRIDLSSMPLEEVVKLREQADREFAERRCPAWLRSGPSCNKEKEHEGPHEGHTYVTGPKGSDIKCLLTWKMPEEGHE